MATPRHANASTQTVQSDAEGPVLDLSPVVAELRRIADALAHRNEAPEKAEEKPEAALPPGDEALFQRLRAWRAEEARKLGMPPYIVATDRMLLGVVEKKPATVEALREVAGFGPAKTEKYGPSVVEVVAS